MSRLHDHVAVIRHARFCRWCATEASHARELLVIRLVDRAASEQSKRRCRLRVIVIKCVLFWRVSVGQDGGSMVGKSCASSRCLWAEEGRCSGHACYAAAGSADRVERVVGRGSSARCCACDRAFCRRIFVGFVARCAQPSRGKCPRYDRPIGDALISRSRRVTRGQRSSLTARHASASTRSVAARTVRCPRSRRTAIGCVTA